jgi:hypothetical protein
LAAWHPLSSDNRVARASGATPSGAFASAVDIALDDTIAVLACSRSKVRRETVDDKLPWEDFADGI